MGLDIINKIRKSKLLTSQQLSKKSGVPLGTLNKILCGSTINPKLETLKAIANSLDCTLDDFDIIDGIDHNIELIDEIKIKKDEMELISKYRQLSNNQKGKLCDFIEFQLYLNSTENKKK
jgi:transcriptional regulator with XRE-family HTH domain